MAHTVRPSSIGSAQRVFQSTFDDITFFDCSLAAQSERSKSHTAKVRSRSSVVETEGELWSALLPLRPSDFLFLSPVPHYDSTRLSTHFLLLEEIVSLLQNTLNP